MAARAGATHVVVMERLIRRRSKRWCRPQRIWREGHGRQSRCRGQGRWPAKRLEDLGCDFVIHHIGYDERRGLGAMGKPCPSPLDQLREVVAAVKVPVQAVGGLSVEQAIRTLEFGARLVVLGAPLIGGASSATASSNLEDQLRLICDRFMPISIKRVREMATGPQLCQSAQSECGCRFPALTCEFVRIKKWKNISDCEMFIRLV